MTLTLGTAIITQTGHLFIINYISHGSFLKGEQFFSNFNHALRFCRERDLSVIAVRGL